MGLGDLLRPNPNDADSIDPSFIKNRAGTVLPAKLSMYENPHAGKRHERIVRITQYYLWIATCPESPFVGSISPSAAREKAMSKVKDEMENVDQNKMLNAVYSLYEGIAEESEALEQFEADLARLAFAYEGRERNR